MRGEDGLQEGGGQGREQTLMGQDVATDGSLPTSTGPDAACSDPHPSQGLYLVLRPSSPPQGPLIAPPHIQIHACFRL